MIVSELDVFLHASKDPPDGRLGYYVPDHRLVYAVVHFVSVPFQLLDESVNLGVLPVLDRDSGHGALLQYAFVLFYKFVSFHALLDCTNFLYFLDSVLNLGHFVHCHMEINIFHARCYGRREEFVTFALSACRWVEGDASAGLVQT